LPLTPDVVVNWLYQAVVDVMTAWTNELGVGKFDKAGNCPGRGEITVWWGTHLGCVRDQAMIAWDYDADLAIFLSSAVGDREFHMMWSVVVAKLKTLSHRCVMHTPLKKLHVCPPAPLAWSPFKELYQQERERNTGKSRCELVKATSALFKAGKRARAPHGSNCIDIDVYRVKPGKDLTLQGSTKFSVPLDDLFPTTVGVFGPLMVTRPRSAAPLLKEYGANCLKERYVKVIDSGGRAHCNKVLISRSDEIRHTAWPTLPLTRLDAIERS